MWCNRKHIIHGEKGPYPLVNSTVGQEIYFQLSKATKTATAIVDAFTNKQLTFFDVFQKSCDLAEALRRVKFDQQNTVIAVSSENSLEFFMPVIASFFNQSIVNLINHNYTLLELDHCLNISKPRIIFCSSKVVHKFLYLKHKLLFVEKIVVIDSEEQILGAEAIKDFLNSALKQKNVEVDDFVPSTGNSKVMPAIIFHSSGTTGLPKGVTLSHFNLTSMLTMTKDVYQIKHAGLGLLPFFHAYGFFITLLNFTKHIPTIVLKQFEEEIFLKTIQNYKIDVLILAPPLMVFLAKSEKIKNYDLSSVKQVTCGAAPLSKSVEGEVLKRLNCSYIKQGYGLTENTFMTCTTMDKFYKPGSCGKLRPYNSVVIRDPETGKSLGTYEVGEICIQGPSVMMGYYGNLQATKQTFTPDGCWLKTGDLGYYDNDEFIFVIDRVKELIKYKGFQVAPAEVEALLINHPKINDVGVIGLPDDMVGEKPVAFVVKKIGVDLTVEEVQNYVADKLSVQKRLSGGVIFVDAIPKNPGGKILRRELRNMLLQRPMSKSKL